MAMKFPDLPEINWKDLFGNKELPLEPDKLLEAHRKNLEAWAAAQRILTQGFQTITKRQVEIMRDNMSDASGLLRSMISERGFDPGKQADHLKTALEAQRDYLREVSELMTKIQSDAYSIIRERFMEGVGELKDNKKKKEEPAMAPEPAKAAAAANPPPKPKTNIKNKKKPAGKRK